MKEYLGTVKSTKLKFHPPDGPHFFDVTFEDGKTYLFRSTRSDCGELTIGEEVLFEVTEGLWAKKPAEYIKKREVIKTSENAKAWENKSSWNDPKNNKRMAFSLSRSYCFDYFKLKNYAANKQELEKAGWVVYEWITRLSEDRNILNNRWYCVERALKGMENGLRGSEEFLCENFNDFINLCEYEWTMLQNVN